MENPLPDVTSNSANGILGPELPWQQIPIRVSELTSDNLPCVACFTPDEKSDENDDVAVTSRLSPGIRLYARQPVLCYSRVKGRQSRARTIYKDKKGTYLEVGQTLIIPDTYEGEFLVLLISS